MEELPPIVACSQYLPALNVGIKSKYYCDCELSDVSRFRITSARELRQIFSTQLGNN